MLSFLVQLSRFLDVNFAKVMTTWTCMCLSRDIFIGRTPSCRIEEIKWSRPFVVDVYYVSHGMSTFFFVFPLHCEWDRLYNFRFGN